MLIAMHYTDEQGARGVEFFDTDTEMNDWLTAHPQVTNLRSHPVNDLPQLIEMLFSDHA